MLNLLVEALLEETQLPCRQLFGFAQIVARSLELLSKMSQSSMDLLDLLSGEILELNSPLAIFINKLPCLVSVLPSGVVKLFFHCGHNLVEAAHLCFHHLVDAVDVFERGLFKIEEALLGVGCLGFKNVLPGEDIRLYFLEL